MPTACNRKGTVETWLDCHELVYFAFPVCDASCAHCWSHYLMLGNPVTAEEHTAIIHCVLSRYSNLTKVIISGGEPCLNPDLAQVIQAFKDALREKLTDPSPTVELSVFTSGRQLIDCQLGTQGVAHTAEAILSRLPNPNHVLLQVSLDENHLAQYRQHVGHWNAVAAECAARLNDEELFCSCAENLLIACERLRQVFPRFPKPRLKIHCKTGRLAYHQNLLDQLQVNLEPEQVILTEGLAKAGSNAQDSDGFEVVPSEMRSVFCLPGATGEPRPLASDGIHWGFARNPYSAAIVHGWWNLTGKITVAQEIKTQSA